MFLDKLVEQQKMTCYRVTRMKLGFRSMDLPEFRIDMEFENMQQLDDAMTVTIHNKEVDKWFKRNTETRDWILRLKNQLRFVKG